ncbi:MAG: aldehyde dehydrogenase family protein, partial [Mangrovicoccus sp.]|nr:aldehyde dehydrogenase family protein [Mangrovicoccus sp.]
MARMIDIVSPIDGSVYASRQILSAATAEAAVARARAAQPGWAARALEERTALVLRASEILG